MTASHEPSFDLDQFRTAYSQFLKPGRILLTGHSHQAWPDVARDALIASFDDAARLVDDKWDQVVFPKVEAVGRAILQRMGFDAEDAIAFGRSTQELVFRLLTSLPLPAFGSRNHAREPAFRIVTTDAEFHSLRRQLTRVAEEGVEVVWVPAQPHEALTERLLEAITPGTSMVAFSAVLFEDAYIVQDLGQIAAKAVELGAVVLIDAYHAFNVVPLDFGPAKASLFVTAGGYKYAAFGEGLSWLRIPSDCTLRPVDTGWFSTFDTLSASAQNQVDYGPKGARFAGATFDPSALYRAHAVLGHWDRFGLTPEKLRLISLHQTQAIIDLLDKAGLGERVVSCREERCRGGFVTVRWSKAGLLVNRLREQGIFVDSRGDLLRIGPAPYLTDDEIEQGMKAITAQMRNGE